MTTKREYQSKSGGKGAGQKTGSRPSRDYGKPKESTPHRGYRRDSYSGKTSSGQGYSQRHNKIKALETVEDIKQDIIRIEKEIRLEIKEIRSMKL